MAFNKKELEYISQCIQDWLSSDQRRMQIIGSNYYEGKQDILYKERSIVDPETKEKTPMVNVPNNKLVNNLYSFCVDQKASYIFSKPFKVNTENETYGKALQTVFTPKFMRSLKDLAKRTFNGGIGWFYPVIEGDTLSFKVLPAEQMLPFWKDPDHTELEYAVRVYDVLLPTQTAPETKVEIYTKDGVEHYKWNQKDLIPDNVPKSDYATIIYTDMLSQRIEIGMNWDRIPLIPFRYNARETPLISRVKSLQDAINSIMSIFQDNLSEDMRSTILVIQNYDGEDLAEFRRNMAQAGAVKVTSADGVHGGVEPLKIEVNSDNYEAVLKELKRALFNGARCFDPSDELMSSRPNEINLEAMYFTINLDANEMEQEFLASFEDLKWFIDVFLKSIAKKGDFSEVPMNIQFSRDAIIDESAKVDSFVKSFGLLPIADSYKNMPWIKDVQGAIEAYNKEKKEREEEMMHDGMEGYGNGAGKGSVQEADSEQ